MRDDFERLFVAARMPDGRRIRAHLTNGSTWPGVARRGEAAKPKRSRADAAAGRVSGRRVVRPAARANGDRRRRSDVVALPPVPIAAEAEAEAVVPASTAAAGRPATASEGGYSGPLAYRQGEPMRPDVAASFDRLAAAATADGLALIVNSGFRSDAEQAALFAQNPDPQWVAPRAPPCIGAAPSSTSARPPHTAGSRPTRPDSAS